MGGVRGWAGGRGAYSGPEPAQNRPSRSGRVREVPSIRSKSIRLGSGRVLRGGYPLPHRQPAQGPSRAGGGSLPLDPRALSASRVPPCGRLSPSICASPLRCRCLVNKGQLGCGCVAHRVDSCDSRLLGAVLPNDKRTNLLSFTSYIPANDDPNHGEEQQTHRSLSHHCCCAVSAATRDAMLQSRAWNRVWKEVARQNVKRVPPGAREGWQGPSPAA